MKTRLLWLGLILASVTPLRAAEVATQTPRNLAALLDCSGVGMKSLEQWSQDAVSEDSAVATNACHELRGRGPEGLRALLESHAALIALHETNAGTLLGSLPDAKWDRLRLALDQVGAQRDCHASRLYWHTDLELAKATAKAEAKPILSLRLLGRLDEEFSCANSRYFRTTLYPNAEIARFLRENFVLHWQSVRPVPRVTIDFGDGRKLERTITGNSIHYVLDADGRVLDALPGLYASKTFLRELQRAKNLDRELTTLKGDASTQKLHAYHLERRDELQTALQTDLQKISWTRNETVSAEDEEVWQKIASLHVEDAGLDEGARRLIAGKNARAAARRAIAKSITEDPLLRQLRNLEQAISEDTARNEYLFRKQIHDWLATDPAFSEVGTLNRRVYAELFLTPDSDPWLGLESPDAYASLENDGIVLSNRIPLSPANSQPSTAKIP